VHIRHPHHLHSPSVLLRAIQKKGVAAATTRSLLAGRCRGFGGERFVYHLRNMQAGSGVTQPPIRCVANSFAQGKSGKDVKLTTHRQPAPTLIMCANKPLLLREPVTVRSKAHVRGRLCSGIAGSNLTVGMDVRLVCLLCVV